MKGDGFGRWKLGGMFPPRYRVSRCKGYKLDSSWLRMKIVEVNGLKCKRDNRK